MKRYENLLDTHDEHGVCSVRSAAFCNVQGMRRDRYDRLNNMSVRLGVPFNGDHYKGQQTRLDMTAMSACTCSKLTHHYLIRMASFQVRTED